MTYRTTITLEPEAFAFLGTVDNGNRSRYINALLKQEQQKHLEEAILKANQEEAEDLEYQAELRDWDETLPDGLPDES